MITRCLVTIKDVWLQATYVPVSVVVREAHEQELAPLPVMSDDECVMSGNGASNEW